MTQGDNEDGADAVAHHNDNLTSDEALQAETMQQQQRHDNGRGALMMVPTNTSQRKEDWVDKTVKLAQACNSLFSKKACTMCHMYADKQVEFESRQTEVPAEASVMHFFSPSDDAVGNLERVFMQHPSSMEVELYRQFLFDEETVIESVCSRDPEYDSEHLRTPASPVAPSQR